MMTDAPDEWPLIVDTMADLVLRCGSDAFTSAPLLLPSERFFPDELTPNPKGVRRLVRRMMAHAGLGHLHVELSTDEPEPSEGARSPVGFVGLDDRGAVFALWWESSWEELTGHLCFEVARVFRAVHRLDGAASPYRHSHTAAEAPEVGERAAVTAVYLGFGVLALNASHGYEARGHQEGYTAVTSWRHSFAGDLRLVPLAWCLALQTVVRGPADPSVAVALRELRPNQAAAHQRGVTALQPRRDAWFALLALPPPERWPAVRAVDDRVLWHDAADRALDAEEAARKEEEAAVQAALGVYRVAEKRGRILMFGLALFTGVLSPVLLNIRSSDPLYVWGGTGLALAGCYALYRLLGYRYRCSTLTCSHALRPTDERCPGCGVTIVGDIAAGRDELDVPQPGDFDVDWDTDEDL